VTGSTGPTGETGFFGLGGEQGPTGPAGPPGTVNIRAAPTIQMDTFTTSGLTVGTPVNAVIPLLSYSFSAPEFPLLLGVEAKGGAVAALEEVYLTHPTSTSWEANISAQVLDIGDDRIEYNVYYLGSRNA